MWSSLLHLCDWAHTVRSQVAPCDVGCITGGGGAATTATCSASSAFPVAVARAAASSVAAATVASCSGCVCYELCGHVLLGVRGVQAACLQRSVDGSSAEMSLWLSSSSVWCSLLTDIAQAQPRSSGQQAIGALLPFAQQILTAAVRLSAPEPTAESSHTLFQYLFDTLLPALTSALASSRDAPLPLNPASPSTDSSELSAVLRAVPRSFVYRLLVSACVAGADRVGSVGRSLPPALQSLWRHVMPVVDLAAPSVSQLTSLLCSSGPSSPLSLPVVSSYAAGRFSLVRCLASTPVSLSELLSPDVSADTSPAAAGVLVSSTLSTAFDLLSCLSSVSAEAASTPHVDTAGVRVQCGEFILFALSTATADQQQPQQPRPRHRQHRQQQQQLQRQQRPEALLDAVLPTLCALTEQLMLALAAADGEAEVSELIQRAFIAMVAAHTTLTMHIHT